MNWLIIISHAVANKLSYYNAGWDYPDSARRERSARDATLEQWRVCKAWLEDEGLYDDFRAKGKYLI